MTKSIQWLALSVLAVAALIELPSALVHAVVSLEHLL